MYWCRESRPAEHFLGQKDWMGNPFPYLSLPSLSLSPPSLPSPFTFPSSPYPNPNSFPSVPLPYPFLLHISLPLSLPFRFLVTGVRGYNPRKTFENYRCTEVSSSAFPNQKTTLRYMWILAYVTFVVLNIHKLWLDFDLGLALAFWYYYVTALCFLVKTTPGQGCCPFGQKSLTEWTKWPSGWVFAHLLNM